MSVVRPQSADQAGGRPTRIVPVADGAGVETCTAGAGPAEPFRWPPGDRRRCRGVVPRGGPVHHHPDGPGGAQHVGPGHLPVFRAGTETVGFGPAAEPRRAAEHLLAHRAASS